MNKNFNLNKAFKSEKSKFKLWNGLKIVSIQLILFVFTSLFFWMFMHINYTFFEVNGYPGIIQLKDAYYEYIIGEVLPVIGYFFVFLIGLFFVGNYLSDLLLRPFGKVGLYCDQKLNSDNRPYVNDPLSDFQLLSVFGEYFFRWIDESTKEGCLTKTTIPPQFCKIHAPRYEKNFFLNFGLVIVIISICSAISTFQVAVGIHEKTTQLAVDLLDHKGGVSYFLQEQGQLFHLIMWLTVFSHILIYLTYAIHLYNRVSGAAFGIFSTMRAFMKGNFSARVHLINYNHVRGPCRSLNKYLEYLQKNYGGQKV